MPGIWLFVTLAVTLPLISRWRPSALALIPPATFWGLVAILTVLWGAPPMHIYLVGGFITFGCGAGSVAMRNVPSLNDEFGHR